MERLRKLLSDAVEYLEAASPRERRLIASVLVAASVFAGLITYASFSRSIRRNEQALEEKRDDWAKVERLAANYGAQEMERQNLEQRLRQSPGQLMSYVDNLAKQAQVEIGSMSDRGVQSGGTAGKPKESQVEFNLSKVPLDKLMAFVKSIESTPGVVRVRRMRLRKSYDNKDALDVSLAVSTWQL
jgi:type II secretory pathway component PulM